MMQRTQISTVIVRLRTRGPITTAVVAATGISPQCSNETALAYWIPAFAGTTSSA